MAHSKQRTTCSYNQLWKTLWPWGFQCVLQEDQLRRWRPQDIGVETPHRLGACLMLNDSMLNFWCFRISMSPIIIYTYYIIHSYIKVSVEIRRYIVEIEGPLSRKRVDFEQSAKWTVLSSLRWVAPLPCLSRKLSLFNSNATSTNATLNTLKQSLGNSPNSTNLIQKNKLPWLERSSLYPPEGSQNFAARISDKHHF